ncbi:ribosome biogenesis GTPase Der [Enterobacteriaceae endosymbiont of Neohaemonia nigricornis]|uniref:ribosome biogenesis GTPase Der n=1 Tax=Enterobacteriaceae endosymbiont of Neohaemonia nigricornis TaxID=2675792 RepID=UPI001449324F|nr:ribosome biogenesis GTPase Der [Enterobacteriaceae endosymbiont of Neohaemonia nigricornis]QJC30245.1 ribosome biogenesis GTPase Der [Enterobacteriaceae endosymbiont of Neohaemonia nigricornis]
MNYNYPIITILGDNNTGKSFLYNILTKTNMAIVNHIPGFTRDRQYGYAIINKYPYICVDTGNFYQNNNKLDNVLHLVKKQTIEAIIESHLVILLIRGTILNNIDYEFIKIVRSYNKKVIMIINTKEQINILDFMSLGLIFFKIDLYNYKDNKKLYKIIYSYIKTLYKKENTNFINKNKYVYKKQIIKVSIIGMPNVGKSTFINKVLKKDRVIVNNLPGTTRNSIYITLQTKYNYDIILIDTPGIKKKTNCSISLESINKTLISIKESNIVLFILDGTKQNLYNQDISLIEYIIKQGKPIIIIINKFDLITLNIYHNMQHFIYKKFKFLPITYISAKIGIGINKVFKLIYQIYNLSITNIQTSKLMKILYAAINAVKPNMYKRKIIKIKYIHVIKYCPLILLVHGNYVTKLNQHYKRYLINFFSKQLTYIGIPILFKFKDNTNPYIKK